MAEESWPIRAVAFDLDGLIVDTEPIFAEAARQFLARRGRQPLDAVIRAMIGQPARQAIPLFRERHQLAESDERIAAEMADLFYAILGHEPAPLLPGFDALLEGVERKGLPRAIATSSSRRYVERILSPHGLLNRFDFILTIEDVRQGKPAPEIYQKAATRLGQPPEHMLVLEDSPNGLRAAKAAGARCVVVPHHLIDPAELEGADAVFSSLAEPRLARLIGLPDLPNGFEEDAR